MVAPPCVAMLATGAVALFAEDAERGLLVVMKDPAVCECLIMQLMTESTCVGIDGDLVQLESLIDEKGL